MLFVVLHVLLILVVVVILLVILVVLLALVVEGMELGWKTWSFPTKGT